MARTGFSQPIGGSLFALLCRNRCANAYLSHTSAPRVQDKLKAGRIAQIVACALDCLLSFERPRSFPAVFEDKSPRAPGLMSTLIFHGLLPLLQNSPVKLPHLLLPGRLLHLLRQLLI